MGLEALGAEINYKFNIFPGSLDAISRFELRIHLAVYIGHTLVRQCVMGNEATECAGLDLAVDGPGRWVRPSPN